VRLEPPAEAASSGSKRKGPAAAAAAKKSEPDAAETEADGRCVLYSSEFPQSDDCRQAPATSSGQIALVAEEYTAAELY
jgi:hypothetical protein